MSVFTKRFYSKLIVIPHSYLERIWSMSVIRNIYLRVSLESSLSHDDTLCFNITPISRLYKLSPSIGH